MQLHIDTNKHAMHRRQGTIRWDALLHSYRDVTNNTMQFQVGPNDVITPHQ